MVKRIYIDNSVIGGVFDDEFSFPTKRLFHEIDNGLYTAVISSITIEEIQGAPPQVLSFFKKVQSFAETIMLSEEAIQLSHAYMKEGRFSRKMLVDTLHISVATVNHIELIASWNFKHIVNLGKIRVYNSVNMRLGYPIVEIRTPQEVLHEK